MRHRKRRRNENDRAKAQKACAGKEKSKHENSERQTDFGRCGFCRVSFKGSSGGAFEEKGMDCDGYRCSFGG